jgi:hypothetical protein
MADAPEDIAGVPLAAAFSADAVEPLLAQHFPDLCECCDALGAHPLAESPV